VNVSRASLENLALVGLVGGRHWKMRVNKTGELGTWWGVNGDFGTVRRCHPEATAQADHRI